MDKQPVSPGARLLGLGLDGLANEQATTIVVESDLFDGLRTRVYHKLNPPWDELLRCWLCTGTWIALGQALYRSKARRGPIWLVRDALAIACAGRLIHVVLGRQL